MKKTILTLLTVLLILSVFTGCAKKETAKTEKTYVFATDATWPPLEFIDESGAFTGFEVELVPMIGEAAGVKFEAKNIPWDTIFAGLANGAYDGVASGVSVTEERKLTMDFSTPILNAGQVVIVKTSDKEKFKSIDDLKGEKVGVQIGTTGDLVLDSYPVERKQYDDIGLAIMDMLNNNISACVCDSLIASDFVLANENYKGKLVIAGDPFTTEDIAIAVKKGNKELLDLVNKGLAALEANGELAKLKAKWNLI
jgi:ABC-type amino acid transport/signal transduction systems, periplasmic component/domain